MAEVSDCEKAIPYLRSCKQECDQPITGTSTGSIPSWLNGNLLRNGPGLLEIGQDKMNHIFDGMALIHKFSIQNGAVTYANRFVRSDAYKSNMEANRVTVTEYATRASPDPCRTIFQRFSSMFSPRELTDNDLVNIIKYSDEYYACTETSYIWRIDPDNLESLKKVNLSEYVAAKTALAHSQEDADGTVYNMGSSFTPRAHYNILKFPPKRDSSASAFDGASVLCKIPSNGLNGVSYYHSFGMSEKYFVFVEQPLIMTVSGLLLPSFNSFTTAEKLKWYPQQKVIFHVIRRDTGEILKTKYLSNAFFVFHHINTYEENDQLVVDICSYPDDVAVTSLYVKTLQESCSKQGTAGTVPYGSRAERYVLPLNEADIMKKEIGENLVALENSAATAIRQRDGAILCGSETLIKNDPWQPELPRINYGSFNGKKYKFFYALARVQKSNDSALIKVDTESKIPLVWAEEGRWPSEPIFVPSPGSTEEDDGVIIASLLSKSDTRKVSLLVLNAKTMTELGRTDFETASSVPGDFHGIFIPKEQAS